MIVIGASHLMNFYLVANVIKARRKYGVKYPALYADASNCKDAKERDAFNSVQRAHQNTLENWASIQILILVNSLVFPRASTTLGAVWVLGRIIYGYGYASGGPEGRKAGGIISHLGDIPLILMSFYSGASLAGLV